MEMDLTKARLLEAAGEEFAEKGFDGATVRSISERAKANIAAINYHFGDKEQLYVQAVIEAHRCGGGDVVDLDEVGKSPADRLRRFLGHFLQHILSIDNPYETWHHRLMVREMTRPTQASEILVREVVRPKFVKLTEILRAACPEIDEKRLTAVGFSVIGQCLHYKLGRPIAERVIGREAFAELDVEYLTDHITNFTLAALGLAPPIVGAMMVEELKA